MNSYRPANSTSSISEDLIISTSDVSFVSRGEETEVGEHQIQGTEDWAIHQGYTTYNFEWDVERSIQEVANEVGATDKEIVRGIFNIAQNWEKTISTQFWLETVPDNTIQLAAWNSLAKMKWHFEQKKNRSTRNKNIKYYLIPDWK